MIRKLLFVVALASAHTGASPNPTVAHSERNAADAVVAWATKNAIPISGDLSALEPLVGDARVLAFGEGTHNAHELWELRNRLFAYAVEELGFTAVAAETGYAQSLAADDYIQGREVSREAAARGVFSWVETTFAENVELIEWMRAHNARPSTRRKLRFYGLEMAGKVNPDGRILIQPAFEYIASVNAPLADELASAFEPYETLFTLDAHAKLSRAQQNALLAAAQDLVSAFERRQAVWESRTSPLKFQRAYRHAIAARQLVANFRMDGDGRDIAAAENLRWVLEREGAKGRVFLFAHNSHVAKWREPPPRETQLHSTMAELVEGLLGDDMVVIASLYDRGTTRDWLGMFGFDKQLRTLAPSTPASLNGVMARVPGSLFLLDLRRRPVPAPILDWLSRPRPVRNINVPEEYNDIEPISAFDALLFVRDISPLRPVGHAAVGAAD